MIIGGIDPGREGFITVLDTKSTRGWILKMRYCDKKILDFDDIKLLPKVDIFYLESVRGRGGWAACANFGLGSYYGQIQLALKIHSLKWKGIDPKVWVNSFDNTKGKTKERTLRAYKRFFPHNPLKPRIVKGEELFNNNMIDSIMIALYGVIETGNKIRKWRFQHVN